MTVGSAFSVKSQGSDRFKRDKPFSVQSQPVTLRQKTRHNPGKCLLLDEGRVKVMFATSRQR